MKHMGIYYHHHHPQQKLNLLWQVFRLNYIRKKTELHQINQIDNSFLFIPIK